MKPTLFLTMDGASVEEAERCRQIIHALFQSGAFNVRGGKVVMNFDMYGSLGDIEITSKRWVKDKTLDPLQKISASITIKEPTNQ